MYVKKLEIKKIISLSYSEEDWELYDKEGSAEVARSLNRKLEELVNTGCPREEVQREMEKTLNLYSAWGAADSEGYNMVDHILDRVFKS